MIAMMRTHSSVIQLLHTVIIRVELLHIVNDSNHAMASMFSKPEEFDIEDRIQYNE